MDKIRQRKLSLMTRNKLSKQLRQEYSKIICDKLLSLDLKGNIMSYYPFNSEVDITLFNQNNYVSYPVIYTESDMDAYLPINNEFRLNYYKIYEPDTDSGVKVEKKYLDYVIVPCVSFDEKLYRIGYGKGYYDCFLKDIKAKKIGVAFEIQKVADIEIDENDIKLDMIITEKNIYK